MAFRLIDVFASSSLGTGSVVSASTGCGQFCRRLFPRLTGAWFLVSFILLVGMGVAAAEPSGPSLTIDYDRPPVVAIDAKNVPVAQILNQLAAALHIELDYATPVDQSPTISGSFRGDVQDLLRRVLLPKAGYVIWYRGSAIDRIFVTSSGVAARFAAAASSTGAADTATALDALPVPGPAAPVTAVASIGAGTAPQKANPLSDLLQTQANMMQQSAASVGSAAGSDAPASAASSRSTAQSNPSSAGATQTSLGAMTRTAQANVQMLVKALNAACIGASCTQ